MFRCPGKLLWLSGAPGMGKSTSAQLLARNHGYVYYEADAFAMMLNPFVDLHDDNPSMATAKQRILKGSNFFFFSLFLYLGCRIDM